VLTNEGGPICCRQTTAIFYNRRNYLIKQIFPVIAGAFSFHLTAAVDTILFVARFKLGLRIYP